MPKKLLSSFRKKCGFLIFKFSLIMEKYICDSKLFSSYERKEKFEAKNCNVPVIVSRFK